MGRRLFGVCFDRDVHRDYQHLSLGRVALRVWHGQQVILHLKPRQKKCGQVLEYHIH